MEKEDLKEIVAQHEEEVKLNEGEVEKVTEEPKKSISVSKKKKVPTKEEIIEKAKKEHKTVWKMKCGVSEFITIPLSRKVYNEAIKAGQDNHDKGIDSAIDAMVDHVLENTIIYPIEWRDHMKSSLYTETISDEIMNLSGFTVETEEL